MCRVPGLAGRTLRRVLYRLLLACAAAAALSGATLAADRAAHVVVVLSSENGPYREFAQAVEKTVRRETTRPPRITVARLHEADAVLSAADKPELVVPVGTRALEHVLHSSIPVPMLAGLIPSTTYDSIMREWPRVAASSAVFLDQPVQRRLALVKIAIPSAHRVGVVLGPATRHLAPVLIREGNKAGIEVMVASANPDNRLIDPLTDALMHADVFLALPDPAVSNNATIPNILLTAYRRRVPVLGYSPGYVRAGAMVGLYSTPAQLGQQVGEIIARQATTDRWTLPPAQYPKYFEIAVNERVAHSLGIPVPDKRAMESRLYELEGVTP
jgi:ABC-type uncharacterized transport system substrate-binding protein